jgi:hypothetical protein
MAKAFLKRARFKTETILRSVILHRQRQRLPLSYKHDEFFAPCDARVNEVALEKHVLLHGREASLLPEIKSSRKLKNHETTSLASK